jgi:hypothetical protein
VFKAVEPDEYGNRETRYIDELRPVVYRHYPGNVVSYGLKVFPSKAADPGGSLDWLRDYQLARLQSVCKSPIRVLPPHAPTGVKKPHLRGLCQAPLPGFEPGFPD